MSRLHAWFGPSRREIWRQLAERLGAAHVEGGFGQPDRVDVSHDDWTISLDCYYNAGTKQTLTRLAAPYTNPDKFRFTIYRHGIFSDLGKWMGMQDIEVDYKDFDEAFVIKGTDESKVRALFADRRIREQLELQPSVYLSIESMNGWFSKAPPNTDRLVFQVPGVINNLDRLEALFTLMAVTLDRLCEMGSAYAPRRSD